MDSKVNFQTVPYVKLAGTQKQKALEILAKGNLLLKKWSVYFPSRKARQFRNEILKGSKNPKFKGKESIPCELLSEFQSDIPFILTIRFEAIAELEGRTVEQTILQGYSGMANKFASKWSIENNPTGLTFHDFLQEAYMQIIEAIYSWLPADDNKPSADIGTFIWHALAHRMSNVANQQGNMLCHLTNTDLALMTRYERTKNKMEEYVTFDEIIEELGLSDKEGRQLSSILTRVYAENQMSSLNDSGNDDTYEDDYTGHRVGIEHESEIRSVEESDFVSHTLASANLSMLELAVMNAAMNQYRGWQTDFAKSSLNPTTGKPYSRMRINQIYEKARQKVERVISSKSFSEAA